MAITYNMKGTSFPSFTVGKQGVTVLQGTIAPTTEGVNGDIYVQAGSTPALWQKIAGVWTKIGNFGSKIFTGTTSVDTSEVADTVTVNVSNKRILEVLNDALSLNGEKLTVKNSVSAITLLTSDTSTTNPVDLVVDLQGDGAFKIQSDADSAIRNSDGSTITIQPGDKTSGVGGSLALTAGNTTASGQAGGNIVLTPGTGGSGAALAQVLVPAGYLAATEASVVNRLSVTDLLVAIESASATHNVAANEQAILVTRSGTTSVVLPSSGIPTGHQVKVKMAAASSTTNVTVNGGGTIDGSASAIALTEWAKATFIWSGTAWFTI